MFKQWSKSVKIYNQCINVEENCHVKHPGVFDINEQQLFLFFLNFHINILKL